MLTNSEVRAYQRCQRAWYLRHALGYGKAPDPDRDTGALPLGTLVHKGLEAWYTEGTPQAIAEATALPEDPDEDVRKMYELAHIMLTGYVEWATETGIDEGLTITSTEQEISAGGLLGKLDWTATEGGKPIIFDAKTTMTAMEQEHTAHMNPQFLHYALIWKLMYGELPEFRIRWLRKVKRTARSTPPFYGEVRFRHSEKAVWQYTQTLQYLSDEMDSRRRDPWARASTICAPNPTRECVSCLFRPVCLIASEDPSEVPDLLHWSYDKVDPLARYVGIEKEEVCR